MISYDIVHRYCLTSTVFVLPSGSHLLVGQPSLMIAILVMVTVFSRITIISSKPCGDQLKDNLCILHSTFHEDDPNISEQVSLLHENDEKKREYKLPSRTNEIKHVADEAGSNTTMVREDFDDEALREDHFTQHLSDVMVNTDSENSEITGLQASEVEDDSEFDRNKDESSSLTGYEELFLEENYQKQINILDNHDTLL